jgi:DNA-binding MarR family transcriptional regulator
MINDLLTNLGDIADAVTGTFMLPGEILLSLFARVAPDTMALLTFGQGGRVVPIVMALIAWTVMGICAVLFFRFCRNVIWQISAISLTLWHRTCMGLASLKMRIVWKFKFLLPRRKKQQADPAAPTIEFDDLDMAVLRSVSVKGPGFAISAPDIAEKFTLRPAQVQRSLDKLSKNKLLAAVIGSTDGFDNYRMTDSGLAFMAMWERQQARG